MNVLERLVCQLPVYFYVFSLIYILCYMQIIILKDQKYWLLPIFYYLKNGAAFYHVTSRHQRCSVKKGVLAVTHWKHFFGRLLHASNPQSCHHGWCSKNALPGPAGSHISLQNIFQITLVYITKHSSLWLIFKKFMW